MVWYLVKQRENFPLHRVWYDDYVASVLENRNYYKFVSELIIGIIWLVTTIWIFCKSNNYLLKIFQFQ